MIGILLNHKATKVVLESISITTPPTKVAYTRGESFDTTGMVVTATYSNHHTAAVTGYTISPSTMSTIGRQTVTVSYTEGGITANTTVTVSVTASLTGGSVYWNNTNTWNSATYATWDLTGASTVSIPMSGSISNANISGDSWSISFRLLFADNTVITLGSYTTGRSMNGTTFTADLTGKTDTQKASVKMQAVGSYSYAVATNRYTYNSTSVGTSTAS